MKSTVFKDVILPISILFLACNAGSFAGAREAIKRVAHESQLGPAVSSAVAGDVIVVECDSTGFSVKDKHGTKEEFITIKADHRLQRTIKGTITVQNCTYIKLEGFVITGFASNALKIIASSDIIVTRNQFDFADIEAANGIYTSCTGGKIEKLEISYNEFNNHNAAGTWSGSYIKTWFNGTDVAKNLWIHHNFFANVAPKVDKPGTANPYDGDSDREAIIFGQGESQNIETGNIIECNYFEDCDGEDELVSFKTSANVFRFNTIKNCMGSVHIRFGHSSEVYGNLFYGDAITDFSDTAYTRSANYESAGVVIYGTDHRVYNNHFQNLTGGRTSKHRLPLVIDSGDTDASSGNNHQRARRVLVCHNTFANCQYGIGVGLNYELPPENCIIANNLFSGTARSVFRMSPDAEADSTSEYASNLAWINGDASYGTEKPIFKADPGVRRTTINGYVLDLPGAKSPAIDGGHGNYVTDDVFGGTRTDIPDIGARERGTMKSRLPLTVREVGPNAG